MPQSAKYHTCVVCEKSIDNGKQSWIFCDFYKFLIYFKCNHLNCFDFQHIRACTEPWPSFKCINDACPFGKRTNQNFRSSVLNNENNNTNTGSSINLKASPNLSLLFNQFNYLLSDSRKNRENMASCEYYDAVDISGATTRFCEGGDQKSFENIGKTKPNSLSLSLFHLNTCLSTKVFMATRFLLKPQIRHSVLLL